MDVGSVSLIGPRRNLPTWLVGIEIWFRRGFGKEKEEKKEKGGESEKQRGRKVKRIPKTKK